MNNKGKGIMENWDPNKSETLSEDIYISPKIIEEHGRKVKKEVFNLIGIQNPDDILPKKKRFLPANYLIRYASIAVMVLIVAGGILTYINHTRTGNNDQSLFAKVPEKTFFETDRNICELKLPDGSVITINRGSKISVVKDEFNKNKREVWLEEGEAFFDVAKNPEKPFIVHSGEVQTVVKGTSFNIKAYGELSQNVVSVSSGRVEVKTADKLLGVLTKNKQIVYYRNDHSFKSSELQAHEASGWMDGKLTLNYADGKELKLRIRQFYGMELVINDKAMNDILLQASFAKGTTLTQVMESLKLIYGIKYKINNDQKQVLVSK